MQYLSGSGIGNKPLIFVCHSLGGIVVKEILRKSESSKFDRLKKVYTNTRAVSFIATPHKGSNWANVLTAVNSVIPFFRASSRIEELEKDNTYLEYLSSWYREKANESCIETQAFYEQRKTKGIEVVPHYSANPDVIGCDPIPVNENHIDIAKPERKDSTVYVSLAGLINYHFYSALPADNEEPIPIKNAIPPQTVVIGIVKNDNKVLLNSRQLKHWPNWNLCEVLR